MKIIKLSGDFERSEQDAQQEILFQCFLEILSSDWSPHEVRGFWDVLEGEHDEWYSELRKITGEMDEGDIPHIEATYHKVKDREYKIGEGESNG